MIATKITNPKKSATKSERVNGLTDYITEPERDNGLEKCIASGAENFLTRTHAGRKSEMIALAEEAVRSKDPIDHFVMSWKHNERPTPAQAKEAVEIFVKQCGLVGHQYMWGLHDDTKNMHVHIAINRVHPDTLKVIEINKGFDREATQQAIALIEHRQGWSKEKNARYQTDINGNLVMDKKTGRPAKQVRDQTKQPEPSNKAKAMELQTGEKSAQRIGIENAAPIITGAKSWKELHEQMAAAGMQYERKGSGAIVHIGDVPVKASDVSRAASLSAMQKRLGPYQPPHEINKNDYFDTSRNFTNANAKKPYAFEVGKDAGHGLRSLSKCTLAHSEKSKSISRTSVLQLDACPDRRTTGGLRRDTGRASNEAAHDASANTRSRTVGIRATEGGRRPVALKAHQPGWNEYITIRDTQKAAKSHDTIELQKRHGAERAALATKQKAERNEYIVEKNWKGKGEARNIAQSILATQQAAASLELSEQHKAERKALRDQYKPLPIYKQWKEQPLIVCEAVRPMIDQHITRDRQPSALVQMLKSLSHSTDSRHHITYQFAGKDIFRDEGRTIQILDLKSDRGIAAALVTAQQKFGNVLTLTGSPEFQQNAVAVAVANGLTCKFADPALDALRERLQVEKYQAERAAAAAARAAVASVKTLNTTDKTINAGLTPPIQSEQSAEGGSLPLPVVVELVADDLADIHKQIAAAKAEGLPDKPVVLAPDAPHDAGGPIIGSNESFVAVTTGREITVYRADQLANIEYDGTAQGHDRFASGNKIEIKRTPDGARAIVSEEREAMQTEQKKQRELDRGHGL